MMVPARARELVYGVEAREVVLDADVGMQEEDESDWARWRPGASRVGSGRGHRVPGTVLVVHGHAWFGHLCVSLCVGMVQACLGEYIDAR
jgi:hypothetical protein